MFKTITYSIFLLFFSISIFAQPDADALLKTIRIGEYRIDHIRFRMVEETPVIRLESAQRYGEKYVIYKNDSLITEYPYIAGECTIAFGEYNKMINGFRYIDQGVVLNICNYTVQVETPTEIDWITDDVDSIWIYPLDSITQNPDGSFGKFIENYAALQPQKLSEQHKQNVLFMYKTLRPVGFITSTPQVRNTFRLTFFTDGNARSIILYYDQFFYGNWSYKIDYSIHSTYNVAQMIWDKHVAITGIQ